MNVVSYNDSDVGWQYGEISFNLGSLTYRYNSVVRPVLYLKSSVKISGGTGTKENPYKLTI